MKKAAFVVIFSLMICIAIPATALAYSVENPRIGEFFTWELLGTYAGCLAATLLITQLARRIWPTAWPTQILSYIVALGTLVLANWALDRLTWESAIICVFNAVIVVLAADGGYNNYKEIKEAIKKSKSAAGSPEETPAEPTKTDID